MPMEEPGMSRDRWLQLVPGDRGKHDSLVTEARYWDAIVLGEPLPGDAVDPDLVATIRRVHALDDTPPPDATYAARLEADLLRSSTQSGAVSAATGVVAERASRETTAAPARWPNLTRRGVVMNLAAMAALLAIVLASAVVTLRVGPLAVRDRDDAPLVLGPGITGETLLLQARLDTLPADPLAAEIERWVLQPGATTPMGTEELSGQGPSAFLIEAGTLTVQSDGPLTVTRSGTTTPATEREPAELELQPGDRGFAPPGVTSLWRNDGAIPARVLEAKISWGDRAFPVGDGVLNYTVVDEYPFAKPELPVVMTVFQITLEPGFDLAADAVPGLEMLKVEGGRLVTIDIDEEGRPLPPVVLGQATRALLAFPPGRVFRSGNGEPVTLLLVTFGGRNPLSVSG
jgi:hypothetical protein